MLNTLSKKISPCIIWKDKYKGYKKCKVGKGDIIWPMEKWDSVQDDMESLCHSWELNPNLWILQPMQKWQL